MQYGRDNFEEGDAMTRSVENTSARWNDPAWQKEMRDNEPVWLDPDMGMWHVFRYQDAATVLSEYGTFGSDFSELFPEQAELVEGNILAMDPPRHHRLRRLVSQAFTPKAIAELDGRIVAITNELLDQTEQSTRLELVSDLAYPLPVIVIAELLGVPAEDRPIFKSWADDLLDQDIIDPTDKAAIAESARRLRKFHDYLREHVVQRRRHPRADLLSDLGAAEIDGQQLYDQEIVGFATVLLLAGHITTTVLLGNSIRCFDEHPAVQRALRANPEALPAAIEEVLRYSTPFSRSGRVTTSEVQLGNRVIPPKSFVTVWMDSANRDERQFDRPDEFVFDRSPNPHLGFGRGIHFCIGAPLARLEAKLALRTLLTRYSVLQVDPDRPAERYTNPGINGVRSLHLNVEPA
jgi:cytochrome P450